MALSRRTFLRNSSAFAAGLGFPGIVSAAARGDIVNVALIGCRSMGWDDLTAMLKHKGVRCLALCDIDQRELARRAVDLAALQPETPTLFSDYRRVLERKDIDAVLIGTPDHWHCLPFVDACRAGKDIYVQKPLANSIAECDAMVDVARKYKGRVIQVGQQQRSGKYWQELVEFVRSGALGRINRIQVWANFRYAVQAPSLADTVPPAGVDYESWLGPARKRPFNVQRFHGSWRTCWDYGGGLVTDWGVHLIDIALWAMDVKTMPLRVLSSGGNFLFPQGAHETFDTLSVTYEFKNFVMTWENNAGIENGPFNKGYGLLFRGSDGYIVANRNGWDAYMGRGKPAKSIKGDGWANRESIANHTADFLQCVRTRNVDTACPVEVGSLCAKYAHIGNIGARVGAGSLVYDDKKRLFDNVSANKLIKPEYRAPWQFPENT